jgi:hypothetical protein
MVHWSHFELLQCPQQGLILIVFSTAQQGMFFHQRSTREGGGGGEGVDGPPSDF